MVAYSFQARFRDPILAGIKRQTIRADRARHARPGERLQLYTGMRTKYCALITNAVVCTSVVAIRLGLNHGWVEMNSRISGNERLDAFARLDGFADWLDLVAFWREHHSDVNIFSGMMVRWEALPEMK